MIKGTNYLAELSEKERLVELRRLARSVYGTEEGALVLTALLQDLHWNQESKYPSEDILKNFATFYLRERLGINLGHSATVALLNKEEAQCK